MMNGTFKKCGDCGSISEDVSERSGLHDLPEFDIYPTFLLCDRCYAEAVKVHTNFPKYANVTLNRATGQVTGKVYMGIKGYVNFVTEVIAFAVDLAGELDSFAFMQMLRIRGNSETARYDRYVIARSALLSCYQPKLRELGLPDDVIEALQSW